MRPLAYVVAATTAIFTLASPAHAYVLAAGDRSDGNVSVSAALGARVYRVVIDADLPLSSYDARIAAHRAVGQRPQLVIGGTGTARHSNRFGIEQVAVAAFRRWPDAYSVSVINEPNESGMSACAYQKTFRRAYQMLKAAGAPLVLYGEWSPDHPLDWTKAAIRKCGKVIADGFAWHAYDAHRAWWGIGKAGRTRKWLAAHRSQIHTPRGFTLPLFVTEYGQITRGPYSVNEQLGAQRWANALRIARQQKIVEMVAWDINEAPSGSKWDSSLVDSSGRARLAFNVVAAHTR